MRNLLVCITATFWSLTSFGQDYDFLPKNHIPLNKLEFAELRNKEPKPTINTYFENGKSFSKSQYDSISKAPGNERLTAQYFADTIQNSVSIVYRMRSIEEQKKVNDDFRQLQKDIKKKHKNLIGESLSNVEFSDLDGKVHRIADLKGKKIFLNFWFTQCAPCIKEMPDLNRIKQTYGTDKIAYFAVTYDNKYLVDSFLKKIQLDFTIIPSEQELIDQLGVKFFPTNMLIDENGKVEFISEVFSPKSNHGLEEIEKKLKKHTKK